MSEEPPPTDVNDRVVARWRDDHTSFERVRQVMRRTYTAQSAAEVADRARVGEKTARKHLEALGETGFVERTATPDRRGTLYRRSDESVVFEQARQLLTEVDTVTLTDSVAEMRERLRSYRETYDADSPVEAAAESDADEATLDEWRTTRRNVQIARVALALREAAETVGADAE